MKKFFKVLLILVVFAVLLVSLVFYLTAGLPKTAEDFFTAAKNGNYSDAYSLTSSGFKSGTTEQQLIDFIEANSFDQYQSASWSNRSMNMSTGQLSGTITTANGNTTPVELHFVKSNSQWLLHSIRKSASGIVVDSAKLAIPTEAELLKLVDQTIVSVAVSIESESMQTLFDDSSQLFKQQHSVDDLDAAFASFFGNGFTRESFPTIKPSFSNEPTIGDNGVLSVSGFYPTGAPRLNFELQYILEGLSWKLVGVNVYSK